MGREVVLIGAEVDKGPECQGFMAHGQECRLSPKNSHVFKKGREMLGNPFGRLFLQLCGQLMCQW